MEAFEDENPFESEPGHLHSNASSRVDITDMPSPIFDAQPSRAISPVSPTSPTSPTRRNAFPSPGSHRQPQTFKSDFCCSRDHWLHSGEDVEILVCPLTTADASLVVATDTTCLHSLRRLLMRSRRPSTRLHHISHTSFELGCVHRRSRAAAPSHIQADSRSTPQILGI